MSFSYRIRQCFCSIPRRWFDLCHMLSSSTNNFTNAQTLSRMRSLSGRMNIERVNIGFFTGFKKIKQQRISFFLGYLRMILWKISTAISIKHRILATFNINKNSILTACRPLTRFISNPNYVHDTKRPGIWLNEPDIPEKMRITLHPMLCELELG